ncbi:hypothetical protein C6A85_000000103000 [Mycobacterium sp. ITM-2017-0098]|nr:hypothetical protein C6A85_000000103000 [Mycobacterium sp. ITM-2017-0098]
MRTPKVRARCARGALVGASSATMTAGAHASAGGGLPGGSALVAVLLLCATIGAMVGAVRVEGRAARWCATAAGLGVAQFLGHLVLATAGHHGGFELMPGPSMMAAHAVAAVVLGAAISAAEYLYVVCSSVLCWLRLFAVRMARPMGRIRRRTTDVVVLRPVLTTGLGMRAPPPAFATA